MLSLGILAVIVLCISGIVWRRRRRWHAYTSTDAPGAIPRESLALRAFAHGNACLAEGRFPEAIDLELVRWADAYKHEIRALEGLCKGAPSTWQPGLASSDMAAVATT